MIGSQRTGRLPVLALFLSVAACSGGAPTSPNGSGEGPGVTGVLVGEYRGEYEAALPYVNVMACTPEVCYYTDTDAAGRFRFLLDAPGDFLIKTTEDLEGRPRRSSPMVPVRVAGDQLVDLGRVYVPALPEDASVRADGTAEAGDGLTLLFDPDADGIPPAVAARRIPSAMIPSYPGSVNERVIAVYALHPFGWETDVPVGVRVEIDAGAGVVFRTIGEIDGRFSDPVPGRTAGNAVVTPSGTGITSLTHLVVSSED